MTTTALRIACSLEPSEMSARLDKIADVGRTALTAVERSGNTLTLRFRPGNRTRDRLQAIAAAEAECCPFLDFEVEARDEQVVMRIAAPEGAELVLSELAAAFSPDREAGRGRPGSRAPARPVALRSCGAIERLGDYVTVDRRRF